jgi:hypothetical protein
MEQATQLRNALDHMMQAVYLHLTVLCQVHGTLLLDPQDTTRSVLGFHLATCNQGLTNVKENIWAVGLYGGGLQLLTKGQEGERNMYWYDLAGPIIAAHDKLWLLEQIESLVKPKGE